MNILIDATSRVYLPGATLEPKQNVKNSPLNGKNEAKLIAEKMKKIWEKSKAYLIPAFLLVGALSIGFVACCVMPCATIPFTLFLAIFVGLTFTLTAIRASSNVILMAATYRYGKEFKKSLSVANDVADFLKEAKKIDNNSEEKIEEFNKKLADYSKKIDQEVKEFTSFPFLAFLTGELKGMSYANIKDKALTIFGFQVQLSRISNQDTKTFFISQFLLMLNKYDKIKEEKGEITDQEFQAQCISPLLEWKTAGQRTNPKDYPVYIWRTIDEMNVENFKDKVLDIFSDYVKESHLS